MLLYAALLALALCLAAAHRALVAERRAKAEHAEAKAVLDEAGRHLASMEAVKAEALRLSLEAAAEKKIAEQFLAQALAVQEHNNAVALGCAIRRSEAKRGGKTCPGACP